MSKIQEKITEMYADVKATHVDVKWIKEKIAYQNGVLADHIKDSDKFRTQVTRNTIWRRVFQGAGTIIYIVLLWIIFKR